MENQTLFFEKQYLRQLPVIGVLVVINLFFIVLFVLQVILGHPLGTKVAPNAVLIIFLIGSWLLTYFTLTAHLTTTISSQGISYQFAPFQRRSKLIAWHQIKTCSIRTYCPLREYGGWGYRYYPKNSAYMISGVVGIQLMLHTGEFILIGTTKGVQAQAALKSIDEVAKKETVACIPLALFHVSTLRNQIGNQNDQVNGNEAGDDHHQMAFT